MRWVTAWILYWLGDAVWWLEEHIFGHFLSIYRIYSFLMGLSCDVQGPSGNGPWSEIVQKD